MRHSTFIRIMFATYELRVMLAILCGLIESVSEAVWLLGRVVDVCFRTAFFACVFARCFVRAHALSSFEGCFECDKCSHTFRDSISTMYIYVYTI